MPVFLYVRAWPVGGDLDSEVKVVQATSRANYTTLTPPERTRLEADVQGKDVLILVHGFNVDRESGISKVVHWEPLLRLPPNVAVIGMLWPGDSVWAHGIDYPAEIRVANGAGQMLASFLDQNFRGAASISFVTHSLGARVVLTAVGKMRREVRRAVFMAGAINNDCLTAEFASAAARIERISVLASHGDQVLGGIFAIGNLLGGILTVGHPWFRAALGREGPANGGPRNLRQPSQIPDHYKYGHGDYLQDNLPPQLAMPLPPPFLSPQSLPLGGIQGWEPAWSAAFAADRLG